MARLTKLEREMVVRAIEFVKAGEWPWEENGPYDEPTRKEAAEQKALDRAHIKLLGRNGSREEG